MALCALPECVLELVLLHLHACSLGTLLLTDGAAKRFLQSRDADEAWHCAAMAHWSRHVLRGPSSSWFDAVKSLEGAWWPALRGVTGLGAKRVFSHMVEQGFLPRVESWACRETLDLVRCVMASRSDLDCRRRMAAFICSSDFIDGEEEGHEQEAPQQLDREGEDDDNLMAVLLDFDLAQAENPEAALRALLLQFPFLPIDAGEGADRVIKAVAKVYLRNHPGEWDRLVTIVDGSEHRDAESVIYVLLYAIIMLNTDLHNPKIRVKMSQREFVQSCSSTVVAQAYSDKELATMYRSIRQSPLRISHNTGPGGPQSQRKLYRLDVPVPTSPASTPEGPAASAASGPRSLGHTCSLGWSLGWSVGWGGATTPQGSWHLQGYLGPAGMALALALAVVVPALLMALGPQTDSGTELST